MTNDYDLTEGNVTGSLMRFFLPVAAGTVIQQLYSTVDALIVGRYVGSSALAAIGGSVAMIFSMSVGIFVALTGGAAVVAAQLYGTGDRGRLAKASATSMAFCAVVGILLSVVSILWAEPLLVLFKTPEETLSDAAVYLRTCSVATTAVMLYNMGAGIIRAAGDSKRPFIYLCACCVINIVLDYVLVKIFGLGVWGAAAATAFSQFISFILVMIRLLKTDEPYRLIISGKYLSLTEIKVMLRFGIPAALQQLMYGLSNSVIQVAVNSLGTATVAAWALTGKVDGVYWAVMTAAGTAIMTFVGQNFGAGRIDRVSEALKKGTAIFMAFTVSVCALIAVFAKDLFPLFVDDAEVIALAVRITLFFITFYPLWTLIELFSGMLKGCGDNIVPTLITVVGIAGIRFLWVYTVFRYYGTVDSLCTCYAVTWTVGSLALWMRYKKGVWKTGKRV